MNVVRYSIRKRKGKWGLHQIETGLFVRVERLSEFDTWKNALFAANLLINADRALNRLLHRSFN